MVFTFMINLKKWLYIVRINFIYCTVYMKKIYNTNCLILNWIILLSDLRCCSAVSFHIQLIANVYDNAVKISN